MNESTPDAIYKEVYDVDIPDLEYFLRQIDCRHGCPVNTDGRGYMMAIHAGNLLEGYKIARGPNPFASICGYICGAPCEMHCRRDRVDKTLTIRAQKRYLDEWFGVDDEAHIKSLQYSYARGTVTPTPNGKKIACVGAGVASLTCAHDLLRLGYAVDVFEMMPHPGGMLTYGVPNYRLKNHVVFSECKAVEHLGARMHFNTKIGRDVTITELQRDFDAVFIGIGLWKSRELPVPGFDAPDVIRGVEYLKVLGSERPWKIGQSVVVVGGGNVAFDVARSSMRNGAKNVTMICLESRDEQTADEFEIEDGVEETIEIINRVGPIGIERDAQGRITGIRVQKLYSLYDHKKRFAPKFVPNAEFVIPCDTIALAIGQAMDEAVFNGWDKRTELILERGIIKTDRATCKTTVPKIYAGGDVAFGPALFITAIRHGQDAALQIDKDLRGVQPYKQIIGEFTTIPGMRSKEYLRTEWDGPSMQSPHDRIHNFNVVENNYSDDAVHKQASRCLQCHISPVFDGSLCIKCNGCVDVCPTRCLKLIPLGKLNFAREPKLHDAVDHFYGVDSKSLSYDDLETMGSAMLKDEDLCIRCALCADKCPTQAVTMDVMNYSVRWVG